MSTGGYGWHLYSDVRYKLFSNLGGWKNAGMFRPRIHAWVTDRVAE